MGQCIHKAKKPKSPKHKPGDKPSNTVDKKTKDPAAVVSPVLTSSANKDVSVDDRTPPKPKDAKQESKNSPQFSRKKLEKLFNEFRDDGENPDMQSIGPDNIERFCDALGIDPEDVVVLVLAYELDAEEMGYFSKKEFMDGFEKLGLDTLDKIRDHVPKLRAKLGDPEQFKSVYRFAFQFAKQDPDQKCIDLDMASGMLNLLLVDRYPLAQNFVEFLKNQESYKGINLDQWSSLLEFLRTIEPDFSGYDENSAWPCIIDEWVEWSKAQSSANE